MYIKFNEFNFEPSLIHQVKRPKTEVTDDRTNNSTSNTNSSHNNNNNNRLVTVAFSCQTWSVKYTYITIIFICFNCLLYLNSHMLQQHVVNRDKYFWIDRNIYTCDPHMCAPPLSINRICELRNLFRSTATHVRGWCLLNWHKVVLAHVYVFWMMRLYTVGQYDASFDVCCAVWGGETRVAIAMMSG